MGGKMIMKVWALFSIENEYDQPDNNLEGLFHHKPTFEELAKFVTGKTLTELSESGLIKVVEILKGEATVWGSFQYRLREIEVGSGPDETWE